MKTETTQEMFQTFQDALWAYGSIEKLAVEADMSVSTLYRYRSAGINFPWPRKKTWEKLLPILGLKFKLVKA